MGHYGKHAAHAGWFKDISAQGPATKGTVSGTTEEVGQVVLFLATEAASFLTGIEILISGGIELGQGVKYPPLHL